MLHHPDLLVAIARDTQRDRLARAELDRRIRASRPTPDRRWHRPRRHAHHDGAGRILAPC